MGLVAGSFYETGGTWRITPGGHLTRVEDGRRITVFGRDGGYRFCIARLGRDPFPYFSDLFEREEEAREAAEAFLGGHDCPHVSLTARWRAERLQRAQAFLAEASTKLRDLLAAFAKAEDAGEVQRIERLAAAYAKGLTGQLQRVLHDGLSAADVAFAQESLAVARRLIEDAAGEIERQEPAAAALARARHPA